MKLLQALLLLPLFLLGACGGGGGSSSPSDPSNPPPTNNPPSSSKALFSVWTEVGTGFVMSLDNGTFNTWQNFIVTNGTLTCNSQVRLSGNNNSGTFEQKTFSGDCAIVLTDVNGVSSTFNLISTDGISGTYSNNGTNLVITTTQVNYLETDGTRTYINLYHPITKTYR